MSEDSVFDRESPRLPGSRNRIAVGTLSVLLAGYVLGSVFRFDSAPVLVAASAVALALFAVLFGFVKMAPWRRNRISGRAEKPVGQFVKEARQTGISLRVAREAYDLLRHHYPRPMCVDLNDELRRDLRMTTGEVLSFRAGLLGRTDRLEHSDDAGRLETVRQLLESIEAAPRNGVDRATIRERVTDRQFDQRPVVENLEFTEASALSDPDFLRRAHFKWVRRRDADYNGFRSRASDQETGKSHAGPFRRATELSRRLAVKQEAGRRAKLAEKRSAEMSAFADKRGEDVAHHGY